VLLLMLSSLSCIICWLALFTKSCVMLLQFNSSALKF
jgi:hypothetical protein